jgi:hypothetical protein
MSSDPRLNSIHLDGARRDQFRLAREFLLNARGQNTFAAEHDSSPELDRLSRTPRNFAPQPRSGEAKYRLLGRQQSYSLTVGLNVIGRASESDVILNNAYVSRRHCAVMVHASGRCELFDIASKNGTFLNGRKLSGPAKLHSGDEIRMCDVQLVFLSGSDSDSSQHGMTLAG